MSILKFFILRTLFEYLFIIVSWGRTSIFLCNITRITPLSFISILKIPYILHKILLVTINLL